MTDAAIRLSDVTVTRSGTEILSGVSLEIQPGQHWVLLGPNGAGKTTVAKLISGREYPSSGTVEVLGEDTGDIEATYLSSRVGFASAHERSRLASVDSVLSLVLAAGWGQIGSFDEVYDDADRARAMDLLAALGIADLADRPFGTLSEGERQRVSIARALMADPEIAILDEPTAGLDLGARETLVQALGEIMSAPTAPTVILITHEIEEIAPGFTHVGLLREGQLVKSGPINEVLTADNLSQAFGIPLVVQRSDDRWWAHAAKE